MAFALLMTGIVLLVAAVRDTQDYVVYILRQDFVGQGNFLFWTIAIIAIGAVGYIDSLKKLSDGLLVLLLLALFLTKGSPTLPSGGFFKQVTDALKGTTAGAGIGGNPFLPDVSISPISIGPVTIGGG